MRKSLLALSAFVLLFITACDKEKDSAPEPVTPTTSNLVGTYKLTKVTMITGSTEKVVTDSLVASCQKDDQTRFNVNMTYNYLDVGTVCSPTASHDGTWALLSNKLIFDGSDTTVIRYYNGSQLELVDSDNTFVTYFQKL